MYFQLIIKPQISNLYIYVDYILPIQSHIRILIFTLNEEAGI